MGVRFSLQRKRGWLTRDGSPKLLHSNFRNYFVKVVVRWLGHTHLNPLWLAICFMRKNRAATQMRAIAVIGHSVHRKPLPHLWGHCRIHTSESRGLSIVCGFQAASVSRISSRSKARLRPLRLSERKGECPRPGFHPAWPIPSRCKR